MHRHLAAVAVLAVLLVGTASADGPAGLYTFVYYNGNAIDHDSIFMSWRTGPSQLWSSPVGHSTDEQNWPP